MRFQICIQKATLASLASAEPRPRFFSRPRDFCEAAVRRRPLARPSVMAPVDLAQLTVQLRAQLKAYLAHSAAIASALDEANSMQTDVESGAQPLEACHERLTTTYELILEQSEAEFQ